MNKSITTKVFLKSTWHVLLYFTLTIQQITHNILKTPNYGFSALFITLTKIPYTFWSIWSLISALIRAKSSGSKISSCHLESFIYYARKIVQRNIFNPWYACDHRVTNISFSKNFACVINGWSFFDLSINARWHKKWLQSGVEKKLDPAFLIC